MSYSSDASWIITLIITFTITIIFTLIITLIIIIIILVNYTLLYNIETNVISCSSDASRILFKSDSVSAFSDYFVFDFSIAHRSATLQLESKDRELAVFLFPFIANFDSDTGERAATSAHHSTNLIASSTINQRLVCKMHRQVVTLVLLKSVTLHDSVTCHTQRSLDMSQRRRGLM